MKRLFFGVALLIFFAGPLPAWSASAPEEIISADELWGALMKGEKLLLLDARNKTSYDEGHIRGAVLPMDADYYRRQILFASGIIKSEPNVDVELREAMKKYPKDAPIVTYCNANCGASKVLQLKLIHLGFTNVRAMEEGFQSWEAKNYPVERAVPRPESAPDAH